MSSIPCVAHFDNDIRVDIRIDNYLKNTCSSPNLSVMLHNEQSVAAHWFCDTGLNKSFLQEVESHKTGHYDRLQGARNDGEQAS